MGKLNVPKGYNCPFCGGDKGRAFHETPLLSTPICEYCDEELFLFSFFDDRPEDSLIEEVEKVTGKSWPECKIVLLQGQNK